VEFAQGAVDVAINQKEVSRFPGDVWRSGFGLQGVLECGSLSRNVARDLVCAGEVKPIVGIAWIEGNGGAIIFDSRFGIAGDEGKVASQAMTIIGVSRRKPHRELQFRQLRPRREEAGSELFADQEEVKAGEKNRHSR